MKANIILEGDIGTGKTSVLKTLPAHKKVFVIALEPGIESILGDTDPERFFWNYIPCAKPGWDTVLAVAKTISTMSADSILKLGGMQKQDYQQFLELIEFCGKPSSSRKGHEGLKFPPLDELGEEWVVVIDGLTGLSKMACNLVVGAKPAMNFPEYQIAQNHLMQFLDLCVNNLKASFILIAHVEKEPDLITGGSTLTVSTIGKALAPKIPKFFDEVIYTYRTEKGFWWSTSETGIALKSRRLALSDKLPASFEPLFKE